MTKAILLRSASMQPITSLMTTSGEAQTGVPLTGVVVQFSASFPPAPLAKKNSAFAGLLGRIEADSSLSEELKKARASVADEFYDEEGETIKSLRLKNGWSQQKFSELLGTTQAQVARLEKGNIDPHRSTCKRLRQVLNISAEKLEEIMDRQERLFESRTTK
ncbi:helix-turn-helix domain-containing protein [Pseudomonas chlororaphis]|uniref:helix-turn-helix domain-containing protein n=1 Tax=Pseudomonas chlororaphis TaxID=587753 RepID=UPI0018AFB626|nr:helix-turn-helix transcriptional regulator [Pseudomonas chlororaphis]